MPALLVGHCYWDTWMIWKALRSRMPALDGTPAVTLIHRIIATTRRSGGEGHGYRRTFKAQPAAHRGRENIRHTECSMHRLGSRCQAFPNFYRYVFVPTRSGGHRSKTFSRIRCGYRCGTHFWILRGQFAGVRLRLNACGKAREVAMAGTSVAENSPGYPVAQSRR